MGERARRHVRRGCQWPPDARGPRRFERRFGATASFRVVHGASVWLGMEDVVFTSRISVQSTGRHDFRRSRSDSHRIGRVARTIVSTCPSMNTHSNTSIFLIHLIRRGECQGHRAGIERLPSIKFPSRRTSGDAHATIKFVHDVLADCTSWLGGGSCGSVGCVVCSI